MQFQHRASDKSYNLDVIRHHIAAAKQAQVNIIAFPEMCTTGYWHLPELDRAQLETLAEPIDGPTVSALSRLAQDNAMLIGAGLLERTAEGQLFNTYVTAMPDGAIHSHRKIHAFEHEAIMSGNRYTVFDTPWSARVGILICYDNNIVENVRATALLGADILLAPHQTGGCLSRSPHAMGLIDPALWRNRHVDRQAIEREFRGPKGREWLMRWLPARAHDNDMFLVFSNGVGEDNGEVRTGNAMILDPYGRILVETCEAGDKLVVADLDMSLLPLATGRRWIRGRRPELYGILTQPLGHELGPRAARFSPEPVTR